MATGRDLVKKDGAIVVFSECSDGVGRGHELFYRLLAEAKSPEETLGRIEREEPLKDQWEAQILAQILSWANVILVSKNIRDSVVEEMHMGPASSPEEALEIAWETTGRNGKITAVPGGPYTIPALEEET